MRTCIRRLTTRVLVLLLFSSLALASPGDNLDEFEDCIFQCHQLLCLRNPYHILQEEHKVLLETSGYNFRRYESLWDFDTNWPFYLTVLGWDCPSNCDYQCQRIITKEREEKGEEVLQFHGKWPFMRIAGIQEPASVLFSIANFVPHCLGFRMLWRSMKNAPTALQSLYHNALLATMLAMLAWLCSAVFHTRDFVLTERLDYFCAGLTVLTGFYAIGFRYWKLYMPGKTYQAWAFRMCCLAAYIKHVHRLVTDWLYTYNMRANITVGLAQNVIWAAVCFSLYKRYQSQDLSSSESSHVEYAQLAWIRPPAFFTKAPSMYALYPLALCAVVLGGMAFEVFDFAPIFDTFDAHSLWHLVTIFPPLMGWYEWMVWDMTQNALPEISALELKKKQ